MCYGWVMVYSSGSWNSVCDDSFGELDANVICQDLYGTNAVMADQYSSTFYSSNPFHGDDGAFTNRESSSIIFDNLHCTGSESSLFDCTHNGDFSHNCGHSEDAWVICSNSEFKAPPSSANQVQLSHEGYGYVMVWGNGRWNTVCDDYFGYNEARVICNSIYGTEPLNSDGWNVGMFLDNNPFATPSYLDRHSYDTIMMDDLACRGDEATLFDCSGNDHFSHNCGHSEDAWVVCEHATVASSEHRAALDVTPKEKVEPVKKHFVGKEIVASEDEGDKTYQPGTNQFWEWQGYKSVENLTADENDKTDKSQKMKPAQKFAPNKN